MMKSHNFIDNSNCPNKKDCGFYNKQIFDKEDVFHYVDYCLKIGNGCEIKKGLEKELEGGNEVK